MLAPPLPDAQPPCPGRRPAARQPSAALGTTRPASVSMAMAQNELDIIRSFHEDVDRGYGSGWSGDIGGMDRLWVIVGLGYGSGPYIFSCRHLQTICLNMFTKFFPLIPGIPWEPGFLSSVVVPSISVFIVLCCLIMSHCWCVCAWFSFFAGIQDIWKSIVSKTKFETYTILH